MIGSNVRGMVIIILNAEFWNYHFITCPRTITCTINIYLFESWHFLLFLADKTCCGTHEHRPGGEVLQMSTNNIMFYSRNKNKICYWIRELTFNP